MILSTKTKKEILLDEVVNNNIPLSDVQVINTSKNIEYDWLDKHVEVWYTVHYTRPPRIVREVGKTICDLINIVYENRNQREAAKAYAEGKLTQMILSRTKLEDQLQRVETERALTTNPRRIKELNRTFKALKEARQREVIKLGTSFHADRIRYGGM